MGRESGATGVFCITGGSGTLGTALTHHLLSQGHKVRTLSRNEHKISALESSIPAEHRTRFSALCGDVRDRYRLHSAFARCDYVIHAAALKGVGRCEYDPDEAIKTNIDGTSLVAEACRVTGVKRAVFISSDKAPAAANLYGMTKAVGERLWLASNRYSAGVGTQFLAVRYGNIFGSAGSVIWKWLESKGTITITDPQCTRFHFKLPDAVRFVLSVLETGETGSLYVPQLPSYRLRDLASCFAGKREVIGLQPGEKLHECMVTEQEAAHATLVPDALWYRIDPAMAGDGNVNEYTSGRNTWRLSVEELRKEIAWLRVQGT